MQEISSGQNKDLNWTGMGAGGGVGGALVRKLRELWGGVPVQTTIGHAHVVLKDGYSAASNLIWNRESLVRQGIFR